MTSSNDQKLGINITMHPWAAAKWEDLTGRNIGKSIAIVIDNKVFSFPVVQGVISGGHSTISGVFTEAEATEIVDILRGGPLQYPLTLLDEKFDCPK
jgi:SecD/SecF fusion protein